MFRLPTRTRRAIRNGVRGGISFSLSQLARASTCGFCQYNNSYSKFITFIAIFGGETRGVPGAKDLDSISRVIVDYSAIARFLSERCARRCHRHSPVFVLLPFSLRRVHDLAFELFPIL
jgi:hypothetical protein